MENILDDLFDDILINFQGETVTVQEQPDRTAIATFDDGETEQKHYSSYNIAIEKLCRAGYTFY